MTDVIVVKKGLDVNLVGSAVKQDLKVAKSDAYAIIPPEFPGIIPRLDIRVGDEVKAGDSLMHDKNFPEIKFVAPVSGEIVAVNRGAKRRILSIVVRPNGKAEEVTFQTPDVKSMNGESVKELLLKGGLWPMIRQRPFDIVANPTIEPRDIFISGFYSAPLAPDFSYIYEQSKEEFAIGIQALASMTKGSVYLSYRDRKFENVQATQVKVEGPHPAGNVGVLINHVKPINKGDVVWTLKAQDVITIGRFLKTGKPDFRKIVALTGSRMKETGYVEVIAGARLSSILNERDDKENGNVRYIYGDVLTGSKVTPEDFFGMTESQITLIPEGDDVHEFLGWAMPRLNRFSHSRTLFSWLQGKKKTYDLDARIMGGERAMIMSNEYDRVFPMDIYPEYLIKAIIAFDINKMENLGIYEVAPEDFALCEFVDTSKLELQKIVRNGLDLLYKETN